ncbi:RNA ligase [Pseudomonas phage EL]|uniref:Anti-CBASS protein Acb1 n=1 Tax=Pseudomonas phage EL TaxID=273133 RepID=Q2Z0V5_9CAUD|nr:hypothetical protein [Pseudomonas aeruginosa]YP_418159.1 RNA ligase [Pseudomonas phage EL]MBS9730302.1 hypothetical protein [Pseudomonas aeruginosa]CAG27220.1 hypothetical protein [Pseudomonas phage EL]
MNNYGYVDVSLVGPEVEEIFGLLLECGIAPAAEYNLHCTLMYDEQAEEPLVKLNPDAKFTAYVTGIDVLGDGLVFNLTSKDLADEHRRLKDGGYTHSFDAFLPHMSVTYDFDEYDMLKVKQAFATWGGRQLTFSKESFGTK